MFRYAIWVHPLLPHGVTGDCMVGSGTSMSRNNSLTLREVRFLVAFLFSCEGQVRMDFRSKEKGRSCTFNFDYEHNDTDSSIDHEPYKPCHNILSSIYSVHARMSIHVYTTNSCTSAD